MAEGGETRDGVTLTNLDQPLFPGADVTKRDLVDYLDAVHGPLLRALAGRPLSVIRVHRDQGPFMQKNLPRYAPTWIRGVTVHAEASDRDVRYALVDDRRTLLWFGNQRAVEYHVPLAREPAWDRPTHLVLDLDPPESVPAGEGFRLAVGAARLVREVLADAGMVAAVKTSGAKGVHVYAPLDGAAGLWEAAVAGRAVAARAERLDPALATSAFLRADRGGRVFVDATRAGGATVVSAYSPRARPGLPVSLPVPWDGLDDLVPGEVTIRSAAALLDGRDPWHDLMPPAQVLDPGLVEEGHTIPVARVQAMHEGKRRARARRSAAAAGSADDVRD
ncbi:MAG: DNA polymerase domain-containing protein [Kineosporiaceae bacterium]